MAPPIDAREKLGTALRQALTQTPLSKISVSALTRAAGVTRQAFYYHFNSLSDLNAWVFREEITAAPDHQFGRMARCDRSDDDVDARAPR